MHKTSGLRDPAASFPLPGTRDDAQDRRQANRAVAVSALGLGASGLIELLLAILTGSVGLLGDHPQPVGRVHQRCGVPRLPAVPPARHRTLSLSPRTGRGPGRHRDRRGHLGECGVRGRRINSATLVADARHSWLDALSSAGALAGLIAVALGQSWGDPVAGLAVTAFICHVGYEITADVMHRLADGVDPAVITGAEAAAGSVPGVTHAHARARWTGRTLRIELEGWVDPDLPVRDADELGRQVAAALAREVPEAGSLTWTTRAAPA
jgi:divalent metal cation (Fe/Co/Zn/Cd) transporter